jgi:hypothetical protein
MRVPSLATAIALAAITAAPLAAQSGAAAMPGMNMDPTNKIVGSGKLPGDWMMRFDPARPPSGRGAATAPATPAPVPAITEVDVQTMGNGVHFRTGPAAIYWSPKNVATGEYSVSATFSQPRSMGHEAYGIFIGGTNLTDSTESYLYFEVKACRSSGPCTQPLTTGTNFGEIVISQRAGDAKLPVSLASGHDPRVNPDNPTTGAATNKLTIHVAADTVHFLVNDKLVRAIPKSMLVVPTDGLAGIRVNHNLDIQVEGFAIKK